MQCPNCSYPSTYVQDTRSLEHGSLTRRRRRCTQCQQKFITVERAQKTTIVVIKDNDSRETFNQNKLEESIRIAFRKRPFNPQYTENFIRNAVQSIEKKATTEIHSSHIIHIVLKHLRKIDITAYIRYAAVYHNFDSLDEFVKFCQLLPTQSNCTTEKN